MKTDKPLNNSCYKHGQKKPAIARAVLSIFFGYMRNNNGEAYRYFANANHLFYLVQIKINKDLAKYEKAYWNTHIEECQNGKIELFTYNIDIDKYEQFKAKLCGTFTWFKETIKAMKSYGLIDRREETFINQKQQQITRRVWAVKALDKYKSFGLNFSEIKRWFKELFYSIFNTRFAKGSKLYLKIHFGDQFLSQMENPKNDLNLDQAFGVSNSPNEEYDLDWMIT